MTEDNKNNKLNILEKNNYYTTVILNKTINNKLIDYCNKQGLSKSAVIRYAINYAVDNDIMAINAYNNIKNHVGSIDANAVDGDTDGN